MESAHHKIPVLFIC